jgi:spore germination cell wall hydrolase CwlJ-like protein
VSAARLSKGDLSDRSLRETFNAEGSALFARHDPGLKPAPESDLLSMFEAPAPLSRWTLGPQGALATNLETPVSSEPNPAARPFVLKASSADRQAATTCLTQAVYYEAGFEPLEGAQAVAQVVLNRVRHPIFPKTVCGVVYQGADLKTGCQFSFACDGSLKRTPSPAAWARARRVAQAALSGFVMASVGEATHYHTQWVSPWWAPAVAKVGQVGVQIFYRWPGALGEPAAFNGRYAGGEHLAMAPETTPAPGAGEANGAEPARVHAVLALTPPSVVAADPKTLATLPASGLQVATLKMETPDIAPSSARPKASSPPFLSEGSSPCAVADCRHW